MKRFPELKPNFWDVIVVLAVIALAALSAMTVWRGGTETGALTAVVTADGQEIDRFAPADLLDAPRTYSYNGVTLTVAEEDGNGSGSVPPTVHPGLRPHRNYFPRWTEHRVPSGPDHHSAHRRRGGQQRCGHCDRLGGEL